jgi:hypothetical protein
MDRLPVLLHGDSSLDPDQHNSDSELPYMVEVKRSQSQSIGVAGLCSG